MDVLVSAWRMFWKMGRKLIGLAWAIVVAIATLVPIAVAYDVQPYVGDPDATGTEKIEKLPKGISTTRIWFSGQRIEVLSDDGRTMDGTPEPAATARASG